MLDALGELCRTVSMQPPELGLISDSTGAQAGAEVASPAYWVRHTRAEIRYGEALRTMVSGGVRTIVELGPGDLRPIAAAAAPETRYLPSLRRDEGRRLLETVGELWACGHDIDWRAVCSRPERIVDLPTYGFQRETYRLGRLRSRAPAERPDPAPRPTSAKPQVTISRAELTDLLRRKLAAVLGIEGDTLPLDTGLFDLGLTSAMVVEVRVWLEAELGREIPVNAVFDYPTIGRLAAYLAAEATGPDARDAPKPTGGPIAVVGMACRFPGGANDLNSFWTLLHEGRDAIGDVPKGRWDSRTHPMRGGFLDVPVDEFDADAFGISPREARAMDPQQRLLLEVATEALDDAGIDSPDLADSATAVYVGINTSDYMQLIAAGGQTGQDAHLATGNTFSVAAGRLSYLLGLRGPSLAIDTACSSSLVAVHLAIRSLRSGESDAALVAGVNLILSPHTTESLLQMRALAPDGRCKTFDASADGYGRGEGCGVIVLKRLSDAVSQGDRIWAVLRGSAVNQDGRSAGLTVPNGQAQREVIQAALDDAGVNPAEVAYVETHGTGTPLGDPLELTSLAAALRPGNDPSPLVVGSVKTNVGHLEAAAGVCSLIKVALSLQHHEIPPHLHLSEPNRYLRWDELPITVPSELVPWQADRIAGVSSFGFSGTNAHVLLAGAPDQLPNTPRKHALPPRRWKRVSYWLPKRPQAEPTPAESAARDAYEIAWRPAEPVTAAESVTEWVIIPDDGGLAGRVADRLRRLGAGCRTASDLSDVTDSVGVIHLAALTQGGTSERTLAMSCEPVLEAARTLPPGSRFWAITRGAVPLPGAAVEPAHAPLWGLCRVLALEHPEKWGGLLDLDPGSADLDVAADTIVAEVLGSDGEDQVAYRRGARHVARLQPAELPAQQAPAVSPDATYLIAGGRGQLGLRVAGWLADRGAHHLVLAGRRPPDLGDPDIARLRAAGVAVHTPSVDITDAGGLRAALDGPWPTVRGIVHAAGISEPAALADLDWTAFRRVLRAKVEGTLALHEVTSDMDLDFFLMFSSASATWGSALAGHYVAASYFQDVFAHRRAQCGLPGQSIDWGWWSGTDMAAGHESYFESMGLHALTDEVAFAALDRLVGSHVVQVTIAPVDWTRLRAVLEARRRRPLLELLGDAPNTRTADDALLARIRGSASDARRMSLLEDLVQTELAAVLGRNPGNRIDREQGFFDAGMDSIMSVDLRTRLESVLGVGLPATTAFEHPTVAGLAHFLGSEVLGLVPSSAPVTLDDERLASLSEDELLRLLDEQLHEHGDDRR